MNWLAEIDNYCERLSPDFWAEPLNALTNLAFIIAGILMWRRVNDLSCRLLCGLLIAIGVGSFLFHTFATRWAALADVVPIGLFIIAYLYLVNRKIAQFKIFKSGALACLFVPNAALVATGLSYVPFFNISALYWTVPPILLAYAVSYRVLPFAYVALLLSASIAIRSVDLSLCQAVPIGTHFVWHILNAGVLAYLISVYARHGLAAQDRQE